VIKSLASSGGLTTDTQSKLAQQPRLSFLFGQTFTRKGYDVEG